MAQVTESCSLAGSQITRPDLLRPTMRSGGCCWSGGVLGGKEAGGVGNLSEAGAVVSSCSPKSASKNAGLRRSWCDMLVLLHLLVASVPYGIGRGLANLQTCTPDSH